MIRSLLVLAVGLLLTGCWTSDQRFFDSGDWARLPFSGEYDVASISDSDGPRRATILSRPDGLIEFKPLPPEEDMPMLMGLVPITGGSGRYFLAMDRSGAGAGGDTYYIAWLTDGGGLAFYFPSCDGTSPIDGMRAETSTYSSAKTCTFSSEDALMKASLEAERFLSSPHVVAVTPFLAFSKADGDDN